MLRALLAALLLANLVFFGWARGWFAPTWPAPRASQHEPGRLAAQVAPERVTVLSAAAASAALLSAQQDAACRQAAAADAAASAAGTLPAPPASSAVALLAAAREASGLKPCAANP